MVRPMATIVDSRGNLYVADPGVKGVHRYSLSESKYEIIRREDRNSLPSPVGFALGPDDRIYVSDSSLNQILVIEPNSEIAKPLILKTEVNQPTGIALDTKTGYLYVVDTADHKIKIFRPDGTLHSSFGQRGTGDGEFNFPTMIWRNQNGHLWITDTLNFRIQEFDEDGRFIRQFGNVGDGTGNLSRPKGVAIDKYGHIYVVDSMFHAFQIFDQEGKLLLYIGGQGQNPGEFWLPTGIYIGSNETIYVADSHNRRIQVFRFIGGKP